MDTSPTPAPLGWRSDLKEAAKAINWGAVGFTFAATWMWVTLLIFVIGLIGKLTESMTILPDTAIVGILPDWYYQFVGRGRSRDVMDPDFWEYLFLTVIAAPLVEESVFRLLVCRVAEVTERFKLKWPIVAVGSFIMFGLIHSKGLYSIPLQGVAGLLWARLYLSYKGEKQLTAYISCVAVHSAYNLSVNVWEVIREWAK